MFFSKTSAHDLSLRQNSPKSKYPETYAFYGRFALADIRRRAYAEYSLSLYCHPELDSGSSIVQ